MGLGNFGSGVYAMFVKTLLVVLMLFFAVECEGQEESKTETAKLGFSYSDDGNPSIVHIYGTGISLEDAKHLLSMSSNATDVHIDAVNATLTNNDLKILSKIDGVTSFAVGDKIRPNELIDSTGIEHIAKMSELNTLELPLVNLRGLKSLAKLKHLRHLDLASSGLTNEQVNEITELKQIESLDLSFTQISDDCLGEIQKIRWLKKLTIRKTLLSNAARVYLETIHKESTVLDWDNQ
jgi:hypothetical protein